MTPGLHKKTPKDAWQHMQTKLDPTEVQLVTNLLQPVSVTRCTLVEAQTCFYHHVCASPEQYSERERRFAHLMAGLWPRERQQVVLGYRIYGNPRSRAIKDAQDIFASLKVAGKQAASMAAQ